MPQEGPATNPSGQGSPAVKRPWQGPTGPLSSNLHRHEARNPRVIPCCSPAPSGGAETNYQDTGFSSLPVKLQHPIRCLLLALLFWHLGEFDVWKLGGRRSSKGKTPSLGEKVSIQEITAQLSAQPHMVTVMPACSHWVTHISSTDLDLTCKMSVLNNTVHYLFQL